MTGKISDYGTLGDRLTRQEGRQPDRGRHVEALDDGQWIPALLVAWERQPDGWWGRVVLARDGEAAEFLITARRLRPLPR